MGDEPRRILVIAPHADDEVIGCGGTIARAAENGCVVHVVVMSVGGIRHRRSNGMVESDRRRAELTASSRILGVAECLVLYQDFEMRLEELPMLDLVKSLDEVLDAGYDEVFLPLSDHNADHRITYEAAMAALRPGARRIPGLVAAYESAFTSLGAAGLTSAMYVDISAYVERKLKALACYESQLQPFPHPVSLEGTRRTAAFRGAEAGREACERFAVIRMVR